MTRPCDAGGGFFDPKYFDGEFFDVGTHVFISHTATDKADAERVGIYLALEHIGVSYDEWEIGYGESIVMKVSEGKSACTHLLLLWSAAAERSQWVQREWASSLAQTIQSGLPTIIPVRLDETPLPDLLADLRYLDLTGDHGTDHREIVSAVTGKAPETAFLTSLVRLFNEEVVVERECGIEWICCPKCGSTNLGHRGVFNDERGEGEGYTRCLDCGYEDCTASV